MDVEQRARELLVKELRDSHYFMTGDSIEAGNDGCVAPGYVVLRAIIAALTPPDLLPVHVVEEVVRALTIHGVSVPESKEEQVARGLQLVLLLCKQTPRQFTPPEGYVLVPVEPTEAMLGSGNEAESESKFASEIYTAMIYARPEVPDGRG